MNWDDARVFLAVEREKTLRGAARTLKLDQATLGRRIAALEHALRATLFLRTSEGYALNAAGEAAQKSAEKMEHSVHELVRRTQGTDTRLAGDVRVTSTEIHAGRIVSTFNSSLMLRTAVKAGLGIGELPIHLAEHDGLVQIWPEPARGAVYEIWLVTHQDLRHTARIAAMIDGIVSVFEDRAN